MMILLLGSNSSGKSLYAEQLIAAVERPRYYIATLMAQNEENYRRVEKHRRQREGLSFTTIEEPCFVGNAAVTANSVVLLEDAANLLGNLIFTAGGTTEQAAAEIRMLRQRCCHLLVVSITGLCADGYEGETADYIRAMEQLNAQLSVEADAVVEMQNGVPILRKGNLNDLS